MAVSVCSCFRSNTVHAWEAWAAIQQLVSSSTSGIEYKQQTKTTSRNRELLTTGYFDYLSRIELKGL